MLEPGELPRLVLAAVGPYIDRDALARQIARENHRNAVRAMESRCCGPDGPAARKPVGPTPAPAPTGS